MEVFGNTRSKLARDFALITPDTHVTSPLVGWQNATGYVHISPEIGARFTQYTAVLESGGVSEMPLAGVQRFVYVREGKVTINLLDEVQTEELVEGGFAYFPAGCQHSIESNGSTANLIIFEKLFEPLELPTVGTSEAAPVAGFPKPKIGHLDQVEGEPFMGDPDARLKTLLPIEPEYDMAVNVFTYQPGATLPQVEIHRMEHGLQMIGGMGVYRLSDDYFPVADGDIIWMASYCPQWFVAMGKQPASYIYYKDIHRQ